MHFGIIGSGVVGLSTALEVQKQFPNISVTILAEKFGSDTTSSVAAGIFRPSLSFTGANEQITSKWIEDSFYYWDELRKSIESADAGVTQLPTYMFSSSDPNLVRNHYLEKLLPIYRRCTGNELKICPGEWKYGSFYSTLLTDCRFWLPWAEKKFQRNGGEILKVSVKSLNQFDGKFDVIFNCSGLGAKFLCNDKYLVPIRGQVIKVKAPWIKIAFYSDSDTYIIPGFDGSVTLGGTRQYESWNLEPDKYDSLSIRDRCESLVPSLKKAPVIREAVGLRPHRSSVRVEMEILSNGGKPLRVIHNYGHGGYGVTTSPGTAKYAVEQAKQILGMSGSKL